MMPRAAILALLCLAACGDATSEPRLTEAQAKALGELQQAQIDANLPARAGFDPLLRRDLAAYFAERGYPAPKITYELLRTEPTQSGVASPKFYAWVSIQSEAGEQQGAVRVAAINGRQFDVTDFVPAEAIRTDPQSLGAFPVVLRPAIAAKVAGG